MAVNSTVRWDFTPVFAGGGLCRVSRFQGKWWGNLPREPPTFLSGISRLP